MDVIKGEIKEITSSTGTGKNGDWKRWSFLINEKHYSTFDAEIGNAFKAGQVVQMEGAQEGQYWNMKSMTAVDGDKVPQKSGHCCPGYGCGVAGDGECGSCRRRLSAEEVRGKIVCRD